MQKKLWRILGFTMSRNLTTCWRSQKILRTYK